MNHSSSVVLPPLNLVGTVFNMEVNPTPRTEKRRRILFYSHDGAGLGHLRRICRVVQALQNDATCLVVSGHRDAAWMVPQGCGLVHLPSLDKIGPRSESTRQDGSVCFSIAEAMAFRRKLVEATVTGFDPDAMVVDHLPTGKGHELLPMIRKSDAAKILILRGVDHPEHAHMELVVGTGRATLKHYYSSVLVACDPRICDAATEFGFDDQLARKVEPVGYISQEIGNDKIAAARAERGISEGTPWIVCSCGGGALGERMIAECVRISERIRDAVFDIVIGPRSALLTEATGVASVPFVGRGRVNIHQECRALPLLHASADIVVCAGGYNSFVEVMEGYADVVCVPTQLRAMDEQMIHAQRLVAYCPIQIVTEPALIESTLREKLRTKGVRRSFRGRDVLNFNGAARARAAILNTLSQRRRTHISS